MSEEWKPITQLRSQFQVSSWGRIRRVDTNQIIPLNMGGWGYFFVKLPRNKNGSSYMIHRLVCEAFHGPAPSVKHEVNHIDGKKINNHVDNLEWVTRSQNILHANALKLRDVRGERHPRTKLTNNDVLTIRYLHKTGNFTTRQLADMYHMGENGIGHIISRRSWSHLP